jgi:hypothetical protein
LLTSPAPSYEAPREDKRGAARAARPRPAVAPLEDLPEDFPSDFCVRNTFIDTAPLLSPSLEGFYRHREVQTCPSSHAGRLLQLREALFQERQVTGCCGDTAKAADTARLEAAETARSAAAILARAKDALHKVGFSHVNATDMKTLMRHFGGAGYSDADFEAMLQIWNDPSRRRDPAWPNKFANNRASYFEKRYMEQDVDEVARTLKVLPHQVITYQDPMFAAQNFGLDYRPWAPHAEWVLFNPAYAAIQKAVIAMTDPELEAAPGSCPLSDEANSFKFYSETDIFTTESSNVNRKSLAGAEGIHQDGAELAMIMFDGRENVVGGGESRVFGLDVKDGPYGRVGGVKARDVFETADDGTWTVRKTVFSFDDGWKTLDATYGASGADGSPNGIPSAEPRLTVGPSRDLTDEEDRIQVEDREQHLLLKPFVMTQPGEAIFLYDSRVKHEVRGGLQRENTQENGSRKMLLAFTRRVQPDGLDLEEQGVSYAEAEAELRRTAGGGRGRGNEEG